VLAKVAGRSQVIFPGGDGRLYAFDPSKGCLLWKLDCNPPNSTRWTIKARGTRLFFVGTPVVEKEMLYVGLNSDSEAAPAAPLLAIDLREATKATKKAIKWRFHTREFPYGTYSSPVISDAVVYTVSDHPMRLFAIDSGTGKELWRSHEMEYGNAEMFGSPIASGRNLYVPEFTSIRVFRRGRKKHYLGRIQFEKKVFGTPRIAGDMMYVTCRNKLFALRLPRELR